jgi:type 1 glutamine amidotransferase
MTSTNAALRVLAVTGGHRVDMDAFGELLGAVCAQRGWTFAQAVQPDAQRWFGPRLRESFDVVLCHDIPGLTLRRGTPPTPVGPTPEQAERMIELLDTGIGLVVLHHALAGWPGWAGWAEALGGRYHYAPARLRGRDWPDSGFRFASYTARVAAPEHPVCAGLSEFALTDELYCCPVFEQDLVPLLRAAHVEPGTFHETFHEVLGTPGPPWSHPPASDVLAWAKAAGRSPLVYVQPGDGPQTFAHPDFRLLIANALAWTGSADARAWADEHRTHVPPLSD